jgi:hypothetical protein
MFHIGCDDMLSTTMFHTRVLLQWVCSGAVFPRRESRCNVSMCGIFAMLLVREPTQVTLKRWGMWLVGFRSLDTQWTPYLALSSSAHRLLGESVDTDDLDAEDVVHSIQGLSSGLRWCRVDNSMHSDSFHHFRDMCVGLRRAPGVHRILQVCVCCNRFRVPRSLAKT